MKFFVPEFSAPSSPTEAIAIQKEIASQVKIENDFDTPRVIAGIDVSYDIASNLTRAFIVMLDYESLRVITSSRAVAPTTFPYVPGLLSFREIPAILQAMKRLTQMPHLLMVDGQGIAHPRRLGIAAHLGALTDMPAIGVAKSRLTGTFHNLGTMKGAAVPLLDKGERIGTVLRSKENCNPLFISPGHRIDHDTANGVVLHCLTRYRLPEPTRLADKLSKEKGTGALFQAASS